MAWCSNIATGAAPNDSTSLLKKVVQEVKMLISLPQAISEREGEVQRLKEDVSQLHSQRQSDFHRSGEDGEDIPRSQLQRQAEFVERLLTDENSNIQRIGIIGMPGVGKTQLLDTIHNSEKVNTSFDVIIKLEISRNDISSLQNCVAKTLSLGQLPDHLEGRRDMLRNHLKDRRYLLLLDDMWAHEEWTSDELQELGVSLHDTGSKILLTTREKKVCTKMDVQKIIKVEPLSEEEGWQLFRSRAFQNGNVPNAMGQVAREIAKECKGLPLDINLVAAAVSHYKSVYDWNVTLYQMQSVSEGFYDVHVGVGEKLFNRLRWSYDVLPHPLKTCFLYFAAYPEDTVIYCEQVIDMWISEGLVIGEGDSNLHDIGYENIEDLASRCLIEEAGKDSVGRIFSVKIHDLLRVMAIRIAEKEQRSHFNAGVGVRDFPSEEVLKGCERMSLMRNDLNSLPTTFPCSSLAVLLLGENPGIKEVPKSFLPQLRQLRVLDLSQTGITYLPDCIGNLQHLASLNLYGCKGICILPEAIGDLKELQFLNVSFCDQLQCLPQRISELNRLRALDIRGCRGLSRLPRGISKVVSLERLRMLGSTIRLGFEEEADAERQYACLKDLQTLSRLRVFSAEIKSPVKEGDMGNWAKMRDLFLHFEDANGEDHLPHGMQKMEDLESLSLCHFGGERLPNWVTQFRKLACLCLVGCKQLKELPAELPCLRALWLDKCDKLKELQLGMCFPKLQEMTLQNLESLECVTMATVAETSGSAGLGEGDWPMLKFLEVWECSKLKTLRGRWDELKCLQEIRGQTEWWDAIQWDDPKMEALLEDKFNLYTF